VSTSQPAGASGLRLLTRAEILSAPDLESETVPTPEWEEGSAVRVLALDVNRRQAYFAFISVVTPNADGVKIDPKPFAATDAALTALGAVDEQDRLLFSIEDVEALGAKNPAPIGRIADMVRRLSKLRAEDREAVQAAVDPTSGDSPSDSPVTSE